MTAAQVDMFAPPAAGSCPRHETSAPAGGAITVQVEQKVPIALRPYQEEAVARALGRLGECRSTLVVMPTGTGKTRVGSAVVQRFGGNVLWLAHREELIDQGRADLERYTGQRPGKEKADVRARAGAELVVGSVQTLKGARLEEFAGRVQPGLIVIDEAHHAVSPSYKAIVAAFPDAKVLGLTATPDRADERAMGQVFESVAFVYEILQAIKDGFLCRYRWKRVQVDAIDLTGVASVAGDFNQGELDAVMSVEKVLHGIVRPTIEHAEGRRTIMFCTSVENAHRMAEVFNRYKPASAQAIDGETPIDQRRRILQAHKNGEYQFLCNVGVLTEGYDDPAVSCIGMARPTKSRALYAQMAGRGFRIAPGKENLLVLDFVGNSGRHSLVNAADILDGKWDDEVSAKGRELAEADDTLDAVEAMERAAELVQAQRTEDARRAKIKANVRARVQEVDPFAVFHIAHEAGEADEERFGVAPTEKQLAMLSRGGVDVAQVKTRAQASKLIGTMISRREHDLASFKQLRTLQRYGITKINIGFRRASQVIDAIAANGWKNLQPERIDALLAREPGDEA